MKKNQAKILARAIYDLTAKANKAETVVANFLAYLDQRRLNHLLPSILQELENIHNQEHDTVAVTIESRFVVPEETENKLIKLLVQKLDKKVKVKKIINDDLLGGVLVSYQDKIIDWSLRKQINNLKKQLIS